LVNFSQHTDLSRGSTSGTSMALWSMRSFRQSCFSFVPCILNNLHFVPGSFLLSKATLQPYLWYYFAITSCSILFVLTHKPAHAQWYPMSNTLFTTKMFPKQHPLWKATAITAANGRCFNVLYIYTIASSHTIQQLTKPHNFTSYLLPAVYNYWAENYFTRSFQRHSCNTTEGLRERIEKVPQLWNSENHS